MRVEANFKLLFDPTEMLVLKKLIESKAWSPLRERLLSLTPIIHDNAISITFSQEEMIKLFLVLFGTSKHRLLWIFGSYASKEFKAVCNIREAIRQFQYVLSDSVKVNLGLVK